MLLTWEILLGVWLLPCCIIGAAVAGAGLRWLRWRERMRAQVAQELADFPKYEPQTPTIDYEITWIPEGALAPPKK